VTNSQILTFARLIKSGMNLAEVERLDDAELIAWEVAFGLCDGGSFDWDEMKWRAPE
jgi:hypothetical protein